MKGHVPGCWCREPQFMNSEFVCICARLRIAQRAERNQIVRSIEDGSARLEGRPIGFIEDALAEAVQRVEGLWAAQRFDTTGDEVIAAIKGESA
jgi:hypothetical protein